MPEHFLNGTEVRASLEQVGGEGVPQQMGVHAPRVEAGLLGELPQDQEGAGARERAAARVQEQLLAVPAIEVRAAP
jgi:hypothetical protein